MNLVIYGAGDFALLMQHYFESETNFKVVAFCVDEKYLDTPTLNNLPVVSFESVEDTYPAKDYTMFLAVGYKNMRMRKTLFDKAKDKQYKLASFISKSAHYDNSNVISENCILLQGSILEPYARVDANTFINTGAIICHHAHIKAHSFLAAGSLIGGYSIIEENCFIGFRAIVAQKLILAKETLLAANSLCLANTEEHSMYLGSPARMYTTHKNDGIRVVDDNI